MGPRPQTFFSRFIGGFVPPIGGLVGKDEIRELSFHVNSQVKIEKCAMAYSPLNLHPSMYRRGVP